MPDLPKKACVNCHFFAVKETTTADLRPANQEEREDAREANFEWKNEANHITCYRGIWNSIREPSRSFQEHREVYVEKDREGKCFFFQHRPGMSLEAGEELYDRKKERERFQRRNRVLWVSVFVALFGVIVNTILQLLNLFLSSPGK